MRVLARVSIDAVTPVVQRLPGYAAAKSLLTVP